MRRGGANICGLLLLLVALIACGADGDRTRLVAPPTTPAQVAVATEIPTDAAVATATLSANSPMLPSPTTVIPLPTATTRPSAPPVAPTPTAVIPVPTASATVTPTRQPGATATRPPASTATRVAPTATRPPAPTPTRAAATAVPGAKARTIDRGPASRRMVALTFDAGADRGFAARILDTLRDSGVKATFGMTGKWAEQNPDLVQRMVAEGHLLMNHTYDHGSFTGFSPGTRPLTAEERRRQIERTEAVIAAIVGSPVKPYFRPPYGDYDDAMLTQLGQLGYTHSVMWTVDSLGWKGLSAAEIAARCLDGTEPGAILLFHVGAQSQDAAALPEIIRQLQADGYTFGTIADLLR